MAELGRDEPFPFPPPDPSTRVNELPTYGHAFFDPRMPEVPSSILGVPTDPLIDLGKAIGTVAFLIPSEQRNYRGASAAYFAKYSLDKALTIFPLVEKVQSGQELRREDVRPYRKPIKRLIPKLSVADRWAATTGMLGFGIPIRRGMNKRIEQETPERLAPMLDKANSYLPNAEPYVKVLETFDNPRQEFVTEIDIIVQSIRAATRESAQTRRNTSVVTADDAAYGIRKTIEGILSDRKKSQQQLPIFSGLVIDKVPEKTKLPPSDKLGVVVPEIMAILESVLPEAKRDRSFERSIMQNPHPMRSLALRFKRTDMESLQGLQSLLLPSIKALLPTKGEEIRATFNRVKDFLKTPGSKQIKL